VPEELISNNNKEDRIMVLFRNKHFIRHKAYQAGFTLVELMIVVALSGIVMAAVYSIYIAQQKSYIAQDQVVEMQQNIRAALDLMEREIRMAGYDIGGDTGASITLASAGQISFSLDNNDDDDLDDLGERIDYGFSESAGNDASPNRDGLPDSGGVLSFARRIGEEVPPVAPIAAYEPVADNIEAIGFAYAYDSNSDGQVEINATSTEISWAIPDGAGGWSDLDTDKDKDIDVNDAAPANVTGTANATQLGQIRAVRIWILARAGREDPDYVNPNSYKVGANVIPAANDNFRRRLLSVNVKCRNMGLE
jgi:type IV pilus assembly protein PilW